MNRLGRTVALAVPVLLLAACGEATSSPSSADDDTTSPSPTATGDGDAVRDRDCDPHPDGHAEPGRAGRPQLQRSRGRVASGDALPPERRRHPGRVDPGGAGRRRPAARPGVRPVRSDGQRAGGPGLRERQDLRLPARRQPRRRLARWMRATEGWRLLRTARSWAGSEATAGRTSWRTTVAARATCRRWRVARAWPPCSVDGTTCQEGEGGNGCAAFVNSVDASKAWSAISHGIVDTVPG